MHVARQMSLTECRSLQAIAALHTVIKFVCRRICSRIAAGSCGAILASADASLLDVALVLEAIFGGALDLCI